MSEWNRIDANIRESHSKKYTDRLHIQVRGTWVFTGLMNRLRAVNNIGKETVLGGSGWSARIILKSRRDVEVRDSYSVRKPYQHIYNSSRWGNHLLVLIARTFQNSSSL